MERTVCIFKVGLKVCLRDVACYTFYSVGIWEDVDFFEVWDFFDCGDGDDITNFDAEIIAGYFVYGDFLGIYVVGSYSDAKGFVSALAF